MKCPTENCKGEIFFNISLEGKPFLQKYRLITYFCLICDWKNIKRFQISNLEYNRELEKSSSKKINKFEG